MEMNEILETEAQKNGTLFKKYQHTTNSNTGTLRNDSNE